MKVSIHVSNIKEKLYCTFPPRESEDVGKLDVLIIR